MKKFLSFLVVVSFVAFIPNVAKTSDIIGTWAVDTAAYVYDSSGNLTNTIYEHIDETPVWEQGGEVRNPFWWFELDPSASRYTAIGNTTLNNDMLTYAYNEDYDIWFESNLVEFYLVVIGDMYVGEAKVIMTGNYGQAGWRHDPNDPLQWDDYTGYLDFIPWGYSAETEGMYVHQILSGSRIPIPGAIWLLGAGLIGLVGFRRKFGK